MPKLGLTKENLLTGAAARNRELVMLAMQDRKLHKKSVPHTRIGGIYKGQVVGAGDVNWHAVGLCVARKPTEKVLVFAETGDVFTYVGGVKGSERVGADAKQIRGCNAVGGIAYACGMHRQVYRRTGEGRWKAMHAAASTGNEIVGFEAIDGFGDDDLYAVGWNGEIWHFEKGHWSQEPSPVSEILTAVSAAGDGQVYACGKSGVLVAGSRGDWKRIDAAGLTDDFWDVHWFDGRLYVASMRSLYVLEAQRPVPVEFGIKPPRSCYKLTSADGVLWAVGQENIYSFDGKSWKQWD